MTRSPEFRLKIEKQLARDEGVRSKPYKDTEGIWTVGIGRNLQDVPLNQQERQSILGKADKIALENLEIV